MVGGWINATDGRDKVVVVEDNVNKIAKVEGIELIEVIIEAGLVVEIGITVRAIGFVITDLENDRRINETEGPEAVDVDLKEDTKTVVLVEGSVSVV